MLKYKGYIGNAEYDAEGKIFTGQVNGTRSTLTFEGRTPEEIEKSFRETIELYLQMCNEDGTPHEKPYSGRFNIQISPKLHHDIAFQASLEHKSLNDWVIEALSKAVKS